MRKRIVPGCLLAAGLLGVSHAALAQAAPPITVTVNGTPVVFAGTPPTEIQNAVLVPLRGVFEALQATVRYDAAAKTVYAQKGAANVILPLGASTATVNGQPQPLSQPAQDVSGTTLVPLRFVAQALGAYVQWHADTNTVEIKTAEPHLAALPPPPGMGAVTGQVTGVYADSVPQRITVRVNGQDTQVPLTAQTTIVRSETGQPAAPVPLTQIAPGDEVQVQRDAQGNAISITTAFGEIQGTVKSIAPMQNGDALVTLNDGKTVEVATDAPISMSGRRISLSDIMPNEQVVIRTNPTNSLGTGVAVVMAGNLNPTPPGGLAPLPVAPPPGIGATVPPAPVTPPVTPVAPAPGAPTVTAFTDDASHPIGLGGKITATLTGTPGGKAAFGIPGAVQTVPMTESAAGVYVGTYTVPKNVTVSGAAVLGRLELHGVSSPVVQAAQTVTIDSTPPKVTGYSPERAATVETDRPLIYATFADEGGTGVDQNATRLILDGTDVTALATATPAFVSFKPAQALGSGDHTVRLTLADGAGNVTSTVWTFTISTSHIIRAFTSDAPSGVIIAGTAVHFTAIAPAAGEAHVRIGNSGTVIPLAETQPGVYTGAYTVGPGDNSAHAPAVLTYVTPDGTRVSASLRDTLDLAGGAPPQPVIDQPAEGAYITGPVSVSGTAPAGMAVNIVVRYSGKGLGGLVPLGGTLESEEVTADASGHWHVDDLSLKSDTLFGEGNNTVFTITATAVDSNGDVSPTATVHIRRR